MWRGSGSAGSPRSMWSGTRWCRRSSRPMSDTKNGSRNSRPPEPGPGTRKDRSLKEGALGLFSAAGFVPAKAVMDVLPAGVSSAGGTIPSRVFVYLIPLPAFAMVVRVLLNSEVAILFTVATSVLSAAAARGRWSTLFFLLLVGTAGASRSGRVPDRYRMLWVGVLTAPVCALAAVALEFALHSESGIVWAGIFGAMNGIVAGPIALAILPAAEHAL